MNTISSVSALKGSACFELQCCDAAVENAPLKKQKKESRILRAVKRELAEEQGKAQISEASAAAAADAVGGLNAPGSPAAQDVQQPHSLAAAPASGRPTGSTKQAKIELAQGAMSASAAVDGDAMQGSMTPSAGAKLKKKRRMVNDTLALEREEEQPVMKQRKQGKDGKQKSKKSRGPGPTTGKLLEGAIAMLAARAPQHARR